MDTIEGPVMVIAGPGTGKTQILASRIGKILLETDVFPQNILCLTYFKFLKMRIGVSTKIKS